MPSEGPSPPPSSYNNDSLHTWLGVWVFREGQRALTLQGDTDNSRRAYEEFLAIWKDADPDIPILQDAKAEFAKLSNIGLQPD